MRKLKKFFIAIIVFLFLIFLLSRGPVHEKSELEYGITFSKKQAGALGLDWKKMYVDILDDLGARKIRLPAYWDEVENEEGKFNWNDLDWQVEEAGKRNAEIILSVGGRLPRWPECHFPTWTNNISQEEKQDRTLNYIKTVVERYKNYKQIMAWQIENEPFLSHFGDCPKLDSKFLDKEIAAARGMDSRPIVVTDSGELSIWYPAARRTDIFGTTMYRDTYSSHLKRYIHYPISPGFFRFKKNINSIFAHPQKWIVIELQAEPWAPVPYQNISKEERDKTMDLEKFREILEFGQKTGFKEFYLWGVEWWYWEREVNGDAGMWDEAKGLF